MPTLLEAKREAAEALNNAEAIITAVEQRGTPMTRAEQENYDGAMSKFKAMSATAKAREEMNTIKAVWPNGRPGLDAPVTTPAQAGFQPSPVRLAEARNPEYAKALHAFLSTGGKAHTEALLNGADGMGGYAIPGSENYTQQRLANGSVPKMTAATYEGFGGGSDSAGGYAVSVPTAQIIAELALPDLGVYDAAMVIPTETDIKIPVQTAFGTSALKSESTGTVATFGGNDPALGQTTLASYMVGAARIASWELLQDVKTFQTFLVDDLLKSQRILEGQLLTTGTGNSQPLGVFGNTGNGTGSAYALTGASTDGQVLLNSLFDVTATLKAFYQPNASWIMSRATGLAIRRAQMQANLFVPVATVDADGTERILGRPVFYDQNAPALPTGTTAGVIPVLFGDFKQGYIVGVRGGSGINVKILDQPLALQGQLAILAYRRIDGRVRLAEAIQAITVSHS